jgi:hypothetical protein
MPRPLPVLGANATADVYIAPNAPPAAPDLAGLPIYLQPRRRNIKPTDPYDYVIWIDPTVDLHDVSGAQPSFYVPDRSGLQYVVYYVQIEGRGTAYARKACYCRRNNPTSTSQAANV